eukprot:CAMPEP_0176450622 /NCGR_PEP_ID=MMETSP0127-20121128/27262_1 /TAXON_ID=938130 /ORGANISM="Platyophrya macrostoma, Strain WH" /LENGTH=271 /DNA_ID=CAMNT_0017838345 /DNA_START=266 /DNA_END=1081 /DNA_ORIENTATION=+
MATQNNDNIIYFKRGTSKIEIVYTNENFSFRNFNFPFVISDLVFCPTQPESLLLVSKKSLYRYKYKEQATELLYTADTELESLTVNKQLNITALSSGYKIYLMCSEQNTLLATLLISKPIIETPTLSHIFGNTVLSLFCKDYLSGDNGVCFRCYDIKRLDTELVATDLKRLESDLYLDPSHALMLNKIGYMMSWNSTSKEETKTWLEFRNLKKYGEKELPGYSMTRQDDDTDGTQDNIWSSFNEDKFMIEVRRDGVINVHKLNLSDKLECF